MSAGRCIKKILKRTHLFRIFACSLFQLRRIDDTFRPRPIPDFLAIARTMATAMATHGHGFDQCHGHSHGRVHLHLCLHGPHQTRPHRRPSSWSPCAVRRRRRRGLPRPPPHLQGNEVSERSVSWWHLQRKQTKELTCSLPSSPLLSWLIVVSTATATVVLMVAGPPPPPARRRNVQEKKINKQIGEN